MTVDDADRLTFGVGLPNAIPRVTSSEMVTWSRVAEQSGLSALGATDRFGFGAVDPLVGLAIAAAVTESIELATTVISVPLRERLSLAELVGSLSSVSQNRFTLGVGAGGRAEDYGGSEYRWEARGPRFDDVLTWLAERGLASSVPVIVGGHSAPAYRRVARFGDGFISSGGPAHYVAGQFERARSAWSSAGRSSAPRLWATAYFAFGKYEEDGRRFLAEYYKSAGPYREKVVASLLTSRDSIQRLIGEYSRIGCDRIYFLPTASDPEQVSELSKTLTR